MLVLTASAFLFSAASSSGRLYVTRRAPAGGQGPGLVDANGRVVVQTVEQGGGYWIQDAAAPSLRR